MATIDDILAQKDQAVAILDRQILRAATLGVDDAVVEQLEDAKSAVIDTAYARALNSGEMADAMAAMQRATAEMTVTAARMVSAATFLSNCGKLIDSADHAVSAMKGSAKHASGGGNAPSVTGENG